MPKAKKEETPKNKSFAQAKEKRRLAWEAKQKESGSTEKGEREEFRKFFVKIKGKLNLDKSMEEVIWTHFKAAGFDKKDKFEKGIKHFGYNI